MRKFENRPYIIGGFFSLIIIIFIVRFSLFVLLYKTVYGNIGKELDKSMNFNSPRAIKIHRASLKLIDVQNEARSLAHKTKVRKMLVGFNGTGKIASVSKTVLEASV